MHQMKNAVVGDLNLFASVAGSCIRDEHCPSDTENNCNICELKTINRLLCIRYRKGKGKAVPLQAWTGPEGSRKLRFPDFVTTAQDGGRLSALRTDRLYPQEILLVLNSVRG